ncbi:MAG TPA: A24 family peptidase [Bacillota bacterium]
MSLALPVGLLLLGLVVAWAADRLADILVGDRSRPAGRDLLVTIHAAAALANLAAGSVYGATLPLLAALAVVAALTAVTVTDLRSSLIPNRLLVGAALLTAPLVMAAGLQAPVDMVLGALVCGGLMLLVALLARGGMGGGDVKLSAYIGLVLGWRQGLVALAIGVLLGGLAGVSALVARRRGLRDAIPYGPYLAAGAVLALLGGEALLRWWLGG